MRITTREMNIFETIVEYIADTKAKGKRVDEIFLSQAEYDTLYPLAMHELTTHGCNELMSKMKLFGIQIFIEEQKKVVRTK